MAEYQADDGEVMGTNAQTLINLRIRISLPGSLKYAKKYFSGDRISSHKYCRSNLMTIINEKYLQDKKIVGFQKLYLSRYKSYFNQKNFFHIQ